jgi:hypothetical protein
MHSFISHVVEPAGFVGDFEQLVSGNDEVRIKIGIHCTSIMIVCIRVLSFDRSSSLSMFDILSRTFYFTFATWVAISS